MPRFLFVYHGGTTPTSPEEGEKVMAMWEAWMAESGSALVDAGNPVGKSSTVNADASLTDNGGANPASGYSVVEVADLAAAQEIAKACPHLKSNGSIEIAPIIEM